MGRKLGERVKEVDVMVYGELRRLSPEGEPQLIIKNLRDGAKGLEVWRKLHQRYNPRGAMVAQGISERLQAVEWPKGIDGVMGMLEGIDKMVGEFEGIVGRKYSPDALMGRVMAVMPEEWEQFVRVNPTQYNTWDKLRDYIIKMTTMRQDEEARTRTMKGMGL